MKKTGLWYVGLALLILFIILFSFPNIIGWNRSDIWIWGCPVSQIALLSLPAGTIIALWIMYLGDKQAIKRIKLMKKKEALHLNHESDDKGKDGEE